ncbi:MAG: caspase family protein [Gallionella sp.]
MRSGKKLALLDTCHAGKSLDAGTLLASRGMDEQDIIERMNRRSGATVLMASETSEQALEGYQGHGVFTYALLQGLQGAAANTEGFITTDLLKVWIEDQVPEITDKIFHHKQTPFASLAGQGFPVAMGKKR